MHRKTVAMMLIISFVASGVPYAADYDGALRSLVEARRVRDIESSGRERPFLEEALSALSNSRSIESVLLRLYIAQRLHRDGDVRQAADAFVMAHRLDYRSRVGSHPGLDNDEKRQLMDFLAEREAQIPFIESVDLASSQISPNREGEIGFSVKLNAPATLAVLVGGGTVGQVGRGSRNPTLMTRWQDDWTGRNVAFDIEAVGEAFSVNAKKTIGSRLVLPPGLEADAGGAYRLAGVPFVTETRESRPKKRGWLIATILLAGLTVAMIATPATAGNSSLADPEAEKAAAVASGAAFTLVAGLGYQLVRGKPVEVPDPAAIAHNESLRRDIEVRKQDIKIDLFEVAASGDSRLSLDRIVRSEDTKRLAELLGSNVGESERLWRRLQVPRSNLADWREANQSLDQFEALLAESDRLADRLIALGEYISLSDERLQIQQRQDASAYRKQLSAERVMLEIGDLDREYASLASVKVERLDDYTRAFGTAGQAASAQRLLTLLQEMRDNRVKAGALGSSEAAAQAAKLSEEIDRTRRQQK